MLGTTTVTPQLNVSHWRARISSASVPLVTEAMDETVTVQSPTESDIYQYCDGLRSKRFRNVPPPHHTETKLNLVEGVASVFQSHLPLILLRFLAVNSTTNKDLQGFKLMPGLSLAQQQVCLSC